MTLLSFYGGVNEIGGNKFLLKENGTKILMMSITKNGTEMW